MAEISHTETLSSEEKRENDKKWIPLLKTRPVETRNKQVCRMSVCALRAYVFWKYCVELPRWRPRVFNSFVLEAGVVLVIMS